MKNINGLFEEIFNSVMPETVKGESNYYNKELSKPLEEFIANPIEKTLLIKVTSGEVQSNYLTINLESITAIRLMLDVVEQTLVDTHTEGRLT